MLKTKVTCWFCNQDSQVFLLNKNAWTCETCNQYNGFNKDGDYNRAIPEMQQESHKQYCRTMTRPNSASSGAAHHESVNLLCDKCNNLQELKLKELSQFDTKNEENFDEEYKIFKSKLDHIYDICKLCKLKLQNHLQSQDKQIGAYLSKEKQKTSINQTLRTKHMNSLKQQYKQPQEQKQQSPQVGVQQTPPIVAKKAYTVAGDTLVSKLPSPKNTTAYQRIKPATVEKKYIYEPSELPVVSPSKLITSDYEQQMNKIISTTKLLTKNSNKITCFLLQTILIDLITFVSIVLIFFSDLTNLINDSGIWSIETDNNAGGVDLDENYFFRTCLRVYKYNYLLLALTIVVSAYAMLKRRKVSRMLILIGFCFNLMTHVNFFDFKSEEKYILEVFVSFFLSSYLTMARCYNVLQCVRYIKSE